jgi:hypothetical protein
VLVVSAVERVASTVVVSTTFTAASMLASLIVWVVVWFAMPWYPVVPVVSVSWRS